MSLAYVSTDLNVNSSGGIVAAQEFDAMQILAQDTEHDIIKFDFTDVHPTQNNLPDIPFLIDYLTLNKLSKMPNLDDVKLVHFYGGSYNLTTKFLKGRGIKTTYSCMMHNRQISIQEHEKFYGSYPFQHVKNDKLWQMYVVEALKNVDVVITPGDHPKQNILEEVPNAIVEIIPHGCNIPKEDSIRQIPEQFIVGYLGACGPDKGLYYLIKAWESLNYKDSTLILAGNQTKEFVPQFIKQQQITTGRFHVMGFVKDISDFYNNISLYVQPSASEAYGMETIEAMSYGRPVIASKNAGSSDCITDGVDGFVLLAKDIKGIAQLIDHLKNNSKAIREMGNRAREKSLNYSWDKIKEKYIKVWTELLNL